jgi:colanic acid/amylovoran biosynthesis glycosyltransferase
VRIAYLAPEIPALSATFVYNEILQLELLGTNVIPFSVHEPDISVKEHLVQNLGKRTLYLYSLPKLAILKSNLSILASHPLRYFKALGMLCQDMWDVGIFSRTALGLAYRFYFSGSLAKQLIENKCDHLHVHFAHIPTDIGMYASSLSSVSFSVTSHANDLYERGWLLDKKVQRSSFFATISEFNKHYLANHGVDIEKVKVIRCGVDPKYFLARKEKPHNQIAKVGVIGRLVEKKGINTLIEAIAILKEGGQQFELYIAGNGPLESELKKRAKNLGLTQENIVFLGSIPHSEVAAFIKSLDIFILPCKQDSKGDVDGIPVVLMEAMLSGVPVITSRISGIPELVIDQETGLLIEQNNSEELARAISRLANDEELQNKLSAKAINKVRKDFSLINNTEKLNILFVSHAKFIKEQVRRC